MRLSSSRGTCQRLLTPFRAAFLLVILVCSCFSGGSDDDSATQVNFGLNSHKSVPGRASCATLRNTLSLPNTTIHQVTYVPADSEVTTADTCQSTAEVSSNICRVYAQVATSASSFVKFEMWLPDAWYGRVITIGNGGLSGCIDFGNLDYTSSLHFAAISSNSGHDGDSAVPLLNNPEVLIDFSFRAVHAIAEQGKQIVAQYYGTVASKSYYIACSNGGRQGIQAALRYPADFDGIVAGTPVVNFNHALGWLGYLGTLVGAPKGNSMMSPSFIPDESWPVISSAILAQCDLLDGVQDGILSEPDECFFDPTVLLCSSGDLRPNTEDCLTQAQVRALERIYSPLLDPVTGSELFPRYDPGAESTAARPLVFNGLQLIGYTTSWWQSVVYNDTSHDFVEFGVEDIRLADNINPGSSATWNGDLSAFRKRGGKLITFHGRSDGLVASGNSKRFYDLVSQTLRPHDIDDFYRLFLLPGLTHCYTGPGAWKIGQSRSGSGVASNDSAHNILLALVDWVEGGDAPKRITGTGDDGSTREHCRYPLFKSHWNGGKWECAPSK